MTPDEQTLDHSAGSAGHDFRRELMRTYGFPLAMFALAIIPGLNFTYSGHGGISWFFIPLCFPYILLRGIIKSVRGLSRSDRWYLHFYAITIPGYIALAYPLSWAATTSLRNTFGLNIPTWSFMAVMISPYPYWYFS